MKTEVKTYYTCALCGRTSQSEAKINACEAGHVVLGGDDTLLKQTFKRSGINTEFPEELIFVRPDGTEIGYSHAWTNKAKQVQAEVPDER
ncbi:MAG TPA: hypothetical protein PKB13_04280 [Clostridia bacterium]|nr:hypothetical protein [Clostridia bacterium]